MQTENQWKFTKAILIFHTNTLNKDKNKNQGKNIAGSHQFSPFFFLSRFHFNYCVFL